jgi:outer membrane protein
LRALAFVRIHPPTFAASDNIDQLNMKNFNSVITGILALAIAILFFLHFKSGKSSPATARLSDKDSLSIPTAGRIAYFEMDSIESQYQYIKEVQAQLKSKEQSMAGELQGMRNSYLGRIQQLQQKAPGMSQQEGEAAQAEIDQMQRNMQQKEATLTQSLQEQQFKLMQAINKKIEEYLTDYNKDKGFSYIISRQAGDFIYFKDTTFNITADVVKGLNEQYKKEKASKPEEKKD